MKQDWKQREGWLQQNNLIYAGLIGIGVVLVQPFITAPSLDLAAMICVVAFALAIPLMAVLMMIHLLQTTHRHAPAVFYLSVTKTVALLSACVGVVAAFWHMSWLAGVGILVSGILGLAVYTAYTVRVARDLGFEPSAE